MVDPVAEYSDAWKHTVYGVLGGGSAWYVITMVWMQLPIYQRHFGLELANQLELGYNVGAAPAVLCVRLPARHPLTPKNRSHTRPPHSYLGLLYWLKASGRKAPAPARMFPVLIAVNCAGIVLMCIAVPRSPFFSIWSLVLVNFIGGTVGYTQQVSSFSLALSLVRLPRAALSFPRLPHRPRAPSSSPSRT